MSNVDQSKKTMRHFYCRDVLWQTFEQMANDFDCSIDYLVNEAMRFYARSKSYQPPSPSSPDVQRLAKDSGPRATPVLTRPVTPPPPPQPLSPPVVQAPAAPTPPPRPTTPAARPAPAPASEEAPLLYLVFNHQKILIEKEQFVIGRGSKSSDLAIKDGNISRKHAAVIRRSGVYYIKDLGSTNGIDFKGMRIDNKRIDEGDIFLLCDYELRFTFVAG